MPLLSLGAPDRKARNRCAAQLGVHQESSAALVDNVQQLRCFLIAAALYKQLQKVDSRLKPLTRAEIPVTISSLDNDTGSFV